MRIPPPHKAFSMQFIDNGCIDVPTRANRLERLA
jgi:hypothetical protein